MGIKGEKIKTAIVCGGVIEDISWLKNELRNYDYIIAADSGYDYCVKADVVVNLLIGDFDSIETKIPDNIEIIKLPVKKDSTDFEVCLKYCLDNKIFEATVFGAWGGRPGHSFAAVFCGMEYYKKGLNIILKTEKSEMQFSDSFLKLEKSDDYISIFPLGIDSAKITLKGFEYSLDNYELDSFSPLGVSNRIIDKFATIEIKNGLILVIKEK